MRWLRSAFELREEWHYNNMVCPHLPHIAPRLNLSTVQGYMLAQHLVERYSGQDLPSFAAERIFGPLNMSSSTYSSEAANATGRMSQSFSWFSRRIPTWVTDADNPFLAGAGSMLSTVDDLAIWAKLLLNATTAPIPRAILADCMAPHALMARGDMTYGFGFVQHHYNGHRVSTLLSSRITTDVVVSAGGVAQRRSSWSLVADHGAPR
jgi:CubicO group peptidase (beta-lactamase class C family)